MSRQAACQASGDHCRTSIAGPAIHKCDADKNLTGVPIPGGQSDRKSLNQAVFQYGIANLRKKAASLWNRHLLSKQAAKSVVYALYCFAVSLFVTFGAKINGRTA